MNKIDKKLLDILVCPVSKESLEQIGDELICRKSNLAYPIKDGIRDFCLSRGLGDVYKRQTY